jgi:putative transposase
MGDRDGADASAPSIHATTPHVHHRTNRYLNNRIEQDHRGIKGRYQPMRGFKSTSSAASFCRSYDELRNFLQPRSNRNEPVPANHRRLHGLSRSLTVLSILQAA